MNGVVCLRSTAKGQGGNLRVVNFVSAYFGTTKPDLGKWAAAGDDILRPAGR